MKYGLALLGVFLVGFILGQQKFEREFRITESEVPMTALEFVQKIEDVKRLKWYREESSQGLSIEAKFKSGNSLVSVEFDTTGTVQDAEITQKINTLEEEVRSKINTELYKEFFNFKIIKLQIQYSGSEDEILRSLKEGKKAKDATLKYEIVIKTTYGEGRSYEVTFDENGKTERILGLIQTTSNHLDY